MKARNATATEEPLEELFPSGVVSIVAAERHWNHPLRPEEEVFVSRAVSKRKREFAAGRACAHEALSRLGAPPGFLPVGPHRAPVWPDGFVGSISHTRGLCVASVARSSSLRSLGLDVEQSTPLPSEIVKKVCRPDELSLFDQQPDPPAGTSWPKLCFSAKESFFKCYFPVTTTWLGFHDVTVRFDNRDFEVSMARQDLPSPPREALVKGRWATHREFVWTAVTWKESPPS
ncbi:MAG: 4'-phosphopantetheinyl transferase superfamily protein [bacterium]|nr:4'-phosphopantetheinyl transferase superfamily protein [bacterium]MCP5069082.1 4'-phosphopantetheinyl transferase superfamily protein [bacterium]